ncbi:MAG: 2-phospho-L-lactate guanylyltransferase [Thermomicrobiales bacterium]
MTAESIIIPFRSLADGKSRLSTALDQADRMRLNHEMLMHVVGASLSVRSSPTVIVVTPDADAVSMLAHAFGDQTSVLQQLPDAFGLNGALIQATRFAIGNGARTIVVLPADLPLLRGTDIETLLRRDAPVVVAPDRHRTGTNGLMQRIDATHGEFEYQFGPGSFRLHLDEAHRLGLDAATAVAMGISFDLDTPSDLIDLRQLEADAAMKEPETVGCV